MRNDKEKLEKVLECIERIEEYTRAGKSSFFSTPLTQDAVVRNFQVIGEAIKDISEELKQQNPVVPWKNVAGFRDKVIHHYFDVDYDKVWNAVEVEIPTFKQQIEDIHRRIIFKVPADREQPSKLEEKLKEQGNRPENET